MILKRKSNDDTTRRFKGGDRKVNSGLLWLFCLLLVPQALGFGHALAQEETVQTDDQKVAQSQIQMIRQLFEVISSPTAAASGERADVLGTIASPTFIRHDLTGTIPNVRTDQGAISFVQSLIVSFPNFKLEILDIFSAGDKLTVLYVLSGTHQGDFLGIAPTGKEIKIFGINIYRFENGQVEETWQLTDVQSLMQQLGVVQPFGEVEP